MQSPVFWIGVDMDLDFLQIPTGVQCQNNEPEDINLCRCRCPPYFKSVCGPNAAFQTFFILLMRSATTHPCL